MINLDDDYLNGIRELSNYDKLIYWIHERESIRLKKEAGKPKPWSADRVLQSYRFCNVHREDDIVTKWIKTNWRDPYASDPNLWFAMVVARLINWPDTLEEIGAHCITKGAIVWNKKEFVSRMNKRQSRKEKLFTGAYMIHADSTHGGTKAEYLAEGVLDPLWKDRQEFHERLNVPNGTLAEFFNLLRDYRDMGVFMSGQIIADLKYVEPLKSAKDWWTWATPGPGSRRGLNRVLGRVVDSPWTHEEWLEEATKVNNKLKQDRIKLHLQDVNNCMCEMDKYCRVLLGEGKPRSKYNGAM